MEILELKGVSGRRVKMFKAHTCVHEILKVVEIFITLKEREVGQRLMKTTQRDAERPDAVQSSSLPGGHIFL